MKGADVVRLLREKKDYLRREFGVRELLLFGSFARGDEGEESEYETFRNYMALKGYLEEFLGRPVDLLVKGGIRRHFLTEIEKEALNV